MFTCQHADEVLIEEWLPAQRTWRDDRRERQIEPPTFDIVESAGAQRFEHQRQVRRLAEQLWEHMSEEGDRRVVGVGGAERVGGDGGMELAAPDQRGDPRQHGFQFDLHGPRWRSPPHLRISRLPQGTDSHVVRRAARTVPAKPG
jgi:hypothetical protein